MFSVFKFLLVGLIGLVVVVPAALLLAFFGVPVLAILAVLAIPVVIVLAIVGLPILLVFLVGAALLAAAFGILGAVFSIGWMLFKLLLFVVLPVMFVAWLVSHLLHRGHYRESELV